MAIAESDRAGITESCRGTGAKGHSAGTVRVMSPEDFFVDGDVLGQRFLDRELLDEIVSGENIHNSDVEVGVALLRLAHDELEAYGTDGRQRTSEEDIGLILHACRLLLKRIGTSFDPPFRDFRTFKSHWLANEAYGSWQARRNILNDLFEPAHRELAQRETTRSCPCWRDLSQLVQVQVGRGWMRRSMSYGATSRRLAALRTTAT